VNAVWSSCPGSVRPGDSAEAVCGPADGGNAPGSHTDEASRAKIATWVGERRPREPRIPLTDVTPWTYDREIHQDHVAAAQRRRETSPCGC